jgi:hypothetical protein
MPGLLDPTSESASAETVTLTQDRLKYLLTYNKDTGNFTWNLDVANISKGSFAGWVSGKLYVQIGIDRKVYEAQILAWLYVTGKFPENEIDHKDTNSLNNRWDNLREVTHAQNHANILTEPGQYGYYGVRRRGNNRWWSQIKVNGISHYLGMFKTPQQAELAYLEAREKFFGEHNHPEYKRLLKLRQEKE